MLKKHQSINDQFAPSRENEGANFAFFIAENSAKIPLSGQTCGQVRKMDLLNSEGREEQAQCLYQRKNEISRDFARK